MPLRPFIHVQVQVDGLHRWPGATAPDGYLSDAHRHLFVAELDITVDHDDRELEINQLTRWLTTTLASFATAPATPGGPRDFGTQSCEQLAARLTQAVLDRHGAHRQVRCTVLEDGLLGGGVTYEPGQPAHA